MSVLYGVDTDKPVTCVDVRDALATCFLLAHNEALNELQEYSGKNDYSNFDDLKKQNVWLFLQKVFSDVGGDFDHPTKESLIRVVNNLKSFSLHFRNPEEVGRHASEISELIKLLP